jgi:hypothetical protein
VGLFQELYTGRKFFHISRTYVSSTARHMLAVGDTAYLFIDLGTAVSAVYDDGTAQRVAQGLEDGGHTILQINQALRGWLVVWVFLQVKELVQIEVTT